MTITSAVFVKSVRGSDPALEDGRPHIAFVGRSNVGKSSVLTRSRGRGGSRKQARFLAELDS